jgi:hypothetical protein
VTKRPVASKKPIRRVAVARRFSWHRLLCTLLAQVGAIPMVSAKSLKKCFVISPIGDETSPIRKHADEVFEYVIKPALEERNIEAIRSDQIYEPGKISDHMFRAIFDHDLCIAVLTGANPNVYYELAVAQSASRPVIILIEKGQLLPFEYDLSITSYHAKTYIGRLKRFLDEIEQRGWRGEDIFQAFRNQSLPSIPEATLCGVKILHSYDGESVNVVNVEGTFEMLPANYDLRSLRYYPDQDGFIPHGNVIVDRHKKTWKINSFDVGGEPGNKRGIEVALAGFDATILLNYWIEAHRVHKEAMETIRRVTGTYGRWLPCITSWPRDLITCHRIEVTRK